MKLYTEEQVKLMIEKSRYTGLTAEFLIIATPPIELPSDEDIGKEFKHSSENWEVRQALEVGAKWMRDKILNK
jgi:hypothetical protein